MVAPEKIKLNDNGEVMSENEGLRSDEGNILVKIKGKEFYLTTLEAIDLIAQTSLEVSIHVGIKC